MYLRTFMKRKRPTRRLVEKNGDLRVINIGMEEKGLVFLKDGWTTLVDLRWRWLFLTFFASFLVSWLLFALVWHLIFWLHSDLDQDKLPDSEMQAWAILRALIAEQKYSHLYFNKTKHFRLHLSYELSY